MLTRVIQFCAMLCLFAATGYAANDSKKLDKLPDVRNVKDFNQVLSNQALAMKMESFTVRVRGDASFMSPAKLLSNSLWYNYTCGYSYQDLGKGVYRYSFVQKDCSRMLAAHRNPELLSELNDKEKRALEVAQQRVKELVNPTMSRYDKVKALHDDLVRRADYSRALGGECTTILLKDGGVCEAYARTMYLMLNMVDVPCLSVVGKARGAHGWNMVQLDNGDWYHLDATWDDPVGKRNKNTVQHDYFCISDTQIARSHTWNRKVYPASGPELAMYFKNEGLYHEDYDSYWEGAQKSAQCGQDSYKAYLSCYESNSSFGRQLQKQLQKKGCCFAVRSYCGVRMGCGGTIRIKFRPRRKKETAKEKVEVEEPDLPVEKTDVVPEWLPVDAWQDLLQDFGLQQTAEEGAETLKDGCEAAGAAVNLQETVEKGTEVLKDGCEAAGKAVEGLQQQGQEAIDNWKKKWF